MKQEIQCTFVACGKKNDRVWVRLSDGVEPSFFATDLEIDAFEGLNRGDEVKVEIEVNPFSKYGTKVVAIS